MGYMDRNMFVWNCMVDSIDNKKLLTERRIGVAIWGAGNIGKRFCKILKELAIPIKCFLDNNVQKHNQLIDQIEVISPEVFLAGDKYTTILLAIGREGKVLKERLKNDCRQIFSPIEYLRYLNQEYVSILEIGPWNAPMFSGEYVKYFDVLPSELLRHKALALGLDADGVPEQIDYVSPKGDPTIVNEKFSFAYSAHVIEHQPDLISHLQKIEKILVEQGLYLLVIPDKRYCFDHYKMASTFIEILAAYYEKREVHTLHTLLAELCNTHNDPVLHWKGEHGTVRNITKAFIESGFNKYKEAKGQYIDAHAWYFTPDSFAEIINKLLNLNLINMCIDQVISTKQNEVDFFVVLKKIV